MPQSFQETVKTASRGSDTMTPGNPSATRPPRPQGAAVHPCSWAKSRTSTSRRLSPHGRRREFHAQELAAIAAGYASHHRGVGWKWKERRHVNPTDIPDGQGPYRRSAARLRRSAGATRSGIATTSRSNIPYPRCGLPAEAGHGGCTFPYGTDEQRHW